MLLSPSGLKNKLTEGSLIGKPPKRRTFASYAYTEALNVSLRPQLYTIIERSKDCPPIQIAKGVSIAAHGTGRTTGHIADLTITNQTDQALTLAEGAYYIPSTNRYQSYVGRTPANLTVVPGQTSTIPVNGYCMDVHVPPVPSGLRMTNYQDWILISNDLTTSAHSELAVPKPIDPTAPQGSTNAKHILHPDHVLRPFTPDDIPDIFASPAYHPFDTLDRTAGSIVVTYPGTEIPLAGTIEARSELLQLAPMLVEFVRQIEDAATIIQANPDFSTPFDASPARELEALIQQTIWITTATLTGDSYQKKDFTANTYRQFVQNTGRSVASLSAAERERLDAGVDDFWEAFTAVGVEAKVFRPGGDESLISVKHFPKCKCEKIEFDVEVYRNGTLKASKSGVEADSRSTTVKLKVDTLQKEQEYEVQISNFEVFCTCPESPTESNRCDVYPPINSSDLKHDDATNSDYTRDGSTHNQVGIYIKNDAEAIKHNAYAKMSDAAWTDDTRTAFHFTLTVEKKSRIPEVSQRFMINSRCESDDCGGSLRATVCDRIVRVILREATD